MQQAQPVGSPAGGTPTQRVASRPFVSTWSIRRWLLQAVRYSVLTGFSILTVFPIVWVFSNSFRTSDDILTSIRLIPESFALDNYTKILTATNIPLAFFNSASITTLSVLLLLAVVLPLSFALARFRFRAATYIYLIFSLAVLVPGVTVLPMTFKLYNELGLLGQKYAISFAYVSGAMPVSIFLMVMFMKSIPSELDEAAIVDGCSIWGLFWRMILPLSRNGIVTVLILAFLAIWNDYMMALVILTGKFDKTLPVVLALAKNEYAVDYGMMSAAIAVAIIPMIIVYVFVKERLISGMAVGAIKG